MGDRKLGVGRPLSDLSARDASFLFTLRNTIPGTKKPAAAQESHINNNYKGDGEKIPSCLRENTRTLGH